MKRLLFFSLVALVVAALSLWGNRLLGTALDAQLAPILSSQLGLPVHLAPIKANALSLRAHTPKLTMGAPADPAVVATDVEVKLSWPDLLHGEVRLVGASARDLMVRPSRWPSSTGPLPDNYRFLDPFLPRHLYVESGRYVDDAGDGYPVSKLRWQREADGAVTVSWSEARAPGEIELTARLQSLPDLLALAPLAIDLSIAVAGKPESAIELKTAIQPGTDSAYALHIDAKAANLAAQVTATGQSPWSLPDKSTTRIPLLALKQLKPILQDYGAAETADGDGAPPGSALPAITLPAHQGHVAIDEIRFGDEIGKDSAFDFTTGEHGVTVSNLTSEGPKGIVNGELSLASGDDGWSVHVDATMRARTTDGSIASQYTGADWLWHTGQANLDGRGQTWDALLNSLQGDIALAGDYRGAGLTPVTIAARLDNRPDSSRWNSWRSPSATVN
ncbi:MAG: hypothetical protein R3E50_12135 [Halioglobus sp.]